MISALDSGLMVFQSTLSVRRATRRSALAGQNPSFQSTLSVRRATGLKWISRISRAISIHALRKESDVIRFSTIPPSRYFNPRSP